MRKEEVVYGKMESRLRKNWDEEESEVKRKGNQIIDEVMTRKDKVERIDEGKYELY